MTAVLLVCVWPVLFFSGAFAAVGDPVQTIANPAGTTIDVFDYWVYNNSGNSTDNYFGTGINRNHSLYFSTNRKTEEWNKYTGEGNGCYQGIVQPVLGEDGYPVLAVGNGESLKYLFDNSEINDGTKPAKRSYIGANYLFTVDNNGYYLFDSSIHDATLDTETGIFDVKEGKQDNGFWPLAKEKPDSAFFGIHMNTEFSIPKDGKVLNPSGNYENMVFEFSGDDDVWLFIDGVLVGDVGGIHNKHALTIDFVTGDVKIWNAKKPEYDTAATRIETTIYEMVVKAVQAGALSQEEFDRIQWNPDVIDQETGKPKTFAGNTYHTMDFFYLERGSGGSNMKMKYNLISTYDFTSHKTLESDDPTVTPVLQANEFRYRLTGYPLEVDDVEGLQYLEAPMPRTRPDMNVIWEPDYLLDPLSVENQVTHGLGQQEKTLVVGNSADGNINYGGVDLETAAIIELYNGKSFRYMYEELPPEGAVLNEDGVTYTWNGQTVSRNSDGTYTFGADTYDLSKYYFTGYFKEDGSIVKTFYEDASYSEEKKSGFINFTNRAESTTLVVKKQMQGSSDNKDFNYTLTVPEKAGKTLYYSKNGGERQSAEIGSNGEFTFSLKRNQYIEIYGIRGKYTLKEKNPGSFWATWQVDGVEAGEGDTFSHSFDLTHNTERVTCTNFLLQTPKIFVNGKKTLLGRDLTADDEFTFTMKEVDLDGNPLKGGSVRQTSADVNGEFKFGVGASNSKNKPIVFSYRDYMNPDKYHDANGNALFYYIISEDIPEGAVDNIMDGVRYSSDSYLVVVTLSYDEENQKLNASWKAYAHEGYGSPVPDALRPETIAGGN